MHSAVQYTRSLPQSRLFPKETVLFYDSILTKNSETAKWIKTFSLSVALKSGENLKTLASLNSILNKLNKMQVPKTTELTFLALGGGSVGDFVGFLASVYGRGRRLIHIPSTWLSAIDSAHGGKNGLNFLGVKNQLGTFYPADRIYITESILKTQPQARMQEALGEVLKTALINAPDVLEYLEDHILKISANNLLQLLPILISKKYEVVATDPFEKNGKRRVLNLGHTMGHVLESYFKLPHGEAVLLGLLFATKLSYQKKILKEKDFIRIMLLFEDLGADKMLHQRLNKISNEEILKRLIQDKKRIRQSQIDFILIQKIGQVCRQKIHLSDILAEVERQRHQLTE